MAVLCLVGLLVWHTPARHLALTVLRLPYTITKTFLSAVLTLPRLPAVVQENAALRAQFIAQQQELVRLRDAVRHDAQRQALLGASPSPGGTVAEVIGRSPIPTQQTVLLNQGARHGVTLETVVIDAAGVIGRVIDVQPLTALVMLVTDPDSRVAGLVERSRESGLLIGQGQGVCRFIYLDASADIQAGDRIVTAGLGGVFPKGLPLGEVVDVVRSEAEGTTAATVRPSARVGRLEEVLCLLRGSAEWGARSSE